jgi:hypothetical protein
MSKGATFENDLLKLLLQGTLITSIAQNATTSPFLNTTCRCIPPIPVKPVRSRRARCLYGLHA